MYNPYNWKIEKNDSECVPAPEPQLLKNCVLNEFIATCTKLDMIRLLHADLKKSLDDIEAEMIKLEEKKISLLNEMGEHP